MKKCMAVLMSVVIMLSLTACSVKKPENLPLEDAIVEIPDSVVLDKTEEWPENSYTEKIPKPAGKVLWSMVDHDNDICGITIRGLSKGSIDSYMDELQNAGFQKIRKMEKPLTGEGYVSLGTLFSDGARTLSLSYAEPVLMITISTVGTHSAGNSFLHSSHITNIYQHSHATYDETDGIGIVTELYVSDRDRVQPKFSEFHGVAVVTLGDRQEYLYFGGKTEQTRSVGCLLKTGIFGQSGEKGTVTVSGIAYSENAVGNCGSFAVTYGITIP